MNRRDFIKHGLFAGLFTVIPTSLFGNKEMNITKEVSIKGRDVLHRGSGEVNLSSLSDSDLIAVRNGSILDMYERAIKSLGGLSRYVKKNNIVLVKPNIGWSRVPDMGANTSPELVGKIVKEAYKCGARKVYVFDNTCNNWKYCYKKSGIEQAVVENGGVMMEGNNYKTYKEVENKKLKYLKEVKIHELYLEADVIINVPVLKQHGGARMTSAIKNLMGVVWNRRVWHRTNLQSCIAEFPLYRKPDLNIVDAYRVMYRNGPRGISRSDVILKKMLLISDDIVAIDAAGAKILGKNRVPYVSKASKLGLGMDDLSKLKIRRITM